MTVRTFYFAQAHGSVFQPIFWANDEENVGIGIFPRAGLGLEKGGRPSWGVRRIGHVGIQALWVEGDWVGLCLPPRGKSAVMGLQFVFPGISRKYSAYLPCPDSINFGFHESCLTGETYGQILLR